MRFCGCVEAVAEQVSKWAKRSLSYHVAGRLSGITDDQFRAAVAEAFGSWQDVCGLTFGVWGGQTASPDIVLTTAPIDGPAGTLAWSQLPTGGDGQILQRYDAAEAFVVAESPPVGKIDLVAVACHEIGHALGLVHAADGSPDLMAPVYQPGRRRPQPNDVRRIQALYGPPSSGPTTPPSGGDGDPVVIRIFGAQRIEIPGYKVTKL